MISTLLLFFGRSRANARSAMAHLTVRKTGWQRVIGGMGPGEPQDGNSIVRVAGCSSQPSQTN
jgi:hypothetical protein